jgi:hypothetical protein
MPIHGEGLIIDDAYADRRFDRSIDGKQGPKASKD